MSDEAERIVELLAQDLRGGQFAPGSWLKQVDLQDRYGVGRAPVRKALETLAGRRLIRHERNRGYSVHPADTDEAAQVLAIRMAIETGFADPICERAGPDRVAELRRLAVEFERIAGAGPFHRLYDVNLAFHRALLGCADNPVMVHMVDDLRMRTSPAPTSQWMDRARIDRSAREHLAMVDAVADRDPARLAGLIRAHILQ